MSHLTRVRGLLGPRWKEVGFVLEQRSNDFMNSPYPNFHEPLPKTALIRQTRGQNDHRIYLCKISPHMQSKGQPFQWTS